MGTLRPEVVGVSELKSKMEELSAAGVRDSEGTFTIDPTAAREKMSRFQLPERAYVLNLVASLVAGGATRLTFRQDPNEVKLTSDAPGIGEAALRNPFGSPFPGAPVELATPQIRELAIGLHGALYSQPRWIKVECDDGESAFCLHLSPEEHRVEQMETTSSSFFRIHVKFPSNLVQTLFTAQKDLVESRLVAERCSLAPLREFFLNKRPGRYALSLDQTLAYKIGTKPGGEHVGVVRAESGLRVEKECARSFVLTLDEAFDGPNINVIHHGVSFLESHDFDWLPLRATVWAGGELQKDLSQAAIVHDSAWFEWMDFLTEQAADLVESLCLRFEKLSEQDAARTLQLGLGLVTYRRSSGRLDDALSLLEKLAPRAESPQFLYQRACVEFESGRHLLALDIFSSLADDYVREDKQAEAADCLRRVLDCRREHDDSPAQMMTHWHDLVSCLYRRRDLDEVGRVIEEMLGWLAGKETALEVERSLESFITLAEVKQDARSVELLQEAVSNLSSRPTCPVCGTRKLPEKGKLVSKEAGLDFQTENGDLRPVYARACGDCGFVWLSCVPVGKDSTISAPGGSDGSSSCDKK